MQFKRLKQLPVPDRDLHDWIIYSQGEAESRMNLLVYATKRDFLSAPLSYALVSMDASGEEVVAKEHSIYQYFEEANSVPEDGFYIDVENGVNVLVVGEFVVEFDFNCAKVIKQLFYCSSSKEALESYLRNLD